MNSSEIMQFQFDTSAVRVIVAQSGVVFFVAKDVALALGYADTVNAIKRHCTKAISLTSSFKDIGVAIHHPPQIQQLDLQTKLITESDVYRLVMRSKLESAVRFQDWVCEDVLPTIRKTGSYSMPQYPKIPSTLSEALLLASQLAANNEAAQKTIENQQQAIRAKDDLIRASNEASVKAGEILVREFVKSQDLIDIGEKRFYQWLREQRFISDSNEPYQRYVDLGYFTYKPSEQMHGGKYRHTLRITPRGKVWLAAKYMNYCDAIDFPASNEAVA